MYALRDIGVQRGNSCTCGLFPFYKQYGQATMLHAQLLSDSDYDSSIGDDCKVVKEYATSLTTPSL